MNHRLEIILLSAAGCFAVVLLALLGADLAAASNSGPRWKRALLRSGLAALAIMGFFPIPLSAQDAKQQDAALEKALAPLLQQRREWNEFKAARAEIAALLVKKDSSPELEKEGRAIARISEAVKGIESLVADGKLTADQIVFFRMESEHLADRVSRAGRQGAAHARPDQDPLLASIEYIDSRLDLLSRIASSETLHSAVAREILESLKPHRDRVSVRRASIRESADLQEKAASARKAIEAVAKALATPRKPELRDSPAWSRFCAIWDSAMEIAENGLPSPCNRKRADRILEELDEAGRLLSGLERTGWLTAAEKALLDAEYGEPAEKVRDRVSRHFSTVSCYSPASLPAPGEQSRRFLAERIPLLEKIAGQKTLKPEVLERVLKTVEAALVDLVEKVPTQEGEEEEPLRVRVKALLARIKSGQ